MAQDAQYGGHQQIPRREPVFEIIAAAEPDLQLVKPFLRHLDCHRPARRRPRLACMEEVEPAQLLDRGFDRLEWLKPDALYRTYGPAVASVGHYPQVA